MTAPAPSKLTKIAETLNLPTERIDRIMRGQISSDLPPISTYFRTKYRLNAEEIRQIEDIFDQIRRNRREHPSSDLPD